MEQLEIMALGMVVWLIWYALVACIMGEPTARQSIRMIILTFIAAVIVGAVV